MTRAEFQAAVERATREEIATLIGAWPTPAAIHAWANRDPERWATLAILLRVLSGERLRLPGWLEWPPEIIAVHDRIEVRLEELITAAMVEGVEGLNA